MAKLFKSEAEGQYYYGDTPDNALPAKVFTSPSDPDAIYYQTDQMADPVLYVPAMSGGAQAVRAAEFGARGFMDSAADTLAAIPELVSSGMRAVGLPAPEEGTYNRALKEGYRGVGRALAAPINAAIDAADGLGPDEPVTALERGAYGGGRGAADAAAFMVPGAALAKLAKGGGTAARVGKAVTTQPVLQTVSGAVGSGTAEATGDTTKGLLAGLATGMAPGVALATAKRAITPFPSQLTSHDKKLAKIAAEKYGIDLTPGQQTHSEGLKTFESTLAQMPRSSGPQKAIYADQRTKYNQAVLKTAGIKADDARPEVIDAARKSLGAQFDDLAARTTVKIDQRFLDDVQAVAAKYSRRLDKNVKGVFQSFVDDIHALPQTAFPKGPLAGQPPVSGRNLMPGTEYQNISSDIKIAARQASNSNPTLEVALNKLAAALDDTLERSGGITLKKEWRAVRRKWRNLLTIERAMQGGTTGSRSAADIPLGTLGKAVKAMDKSGYARGRGDLNELSRVGDFLASAVPPDSGTARRSWMTNLLSGGPVAGAALAASTGVADPGTAAMVAGAPFVLPRALQQLYMTPGIQNYLKNQAVQPGPTRETAALLAKVLAAQSAGRATEN